MNSLNLNGFDPEYLNECLTALVETSQLDGPAKGVANLLIANGNATLSDKQKNVFQKHIAPKLIIECAAPDCGSPISSDMVADEISSGFGGVYCPNCEYQYRDRGDD